MTNLIKAIVWLIVGTIISNSANAQSDRARVIVERSIQAQGGKEKVARLKCMRIKIQGTTSFVPSQPNLPFVIEDVWQMPDKYKTTSTISFMAQKHVQTEAINGNKGWISVDGTAEDMPADAMAEMKEQKYAEDLDRLAFLPMKGVAVTSADEAAVNGKPAACVLVKSAAHKDVKLYFDRTSGLLVKREHKLLDTLAGREVLQEVFFSDYQDKDGLKHYRRIVVHRDGKPVIEGKVTELEFYTKLDGKTFAKP